MASTKDKISDVKPYVERALKDEDLRDNVLGALMAARDAYNDLMGDRHGVTAVASRLATDKDVQDNLKKAVDELRTAADRIQGKDDHTARNTFLLLTGITVGLLFNPVTGPATRRWVRDKVFGPSDDFSYGGGGGGGGGGGSTGGDNASGGGGSTS